MCKIKTHRCQPNQILQTFGFRGVYFLFTLCKVCIQSSTFTHKKRYKLRYIFILSFLQKNGSLKLYVYKLINKSWEVGYLNCCSKNILFHKTFFIIIPSCMFDKKIIKGNFNNLNLKKVHLYNIINLTIINLLYKIML